MLAVDDHAAMAETVADGLAEFGFKGIPISNSTNALRVIAQGQHNAAVTDLRMPGVDGLAIIAKSRGLAPDRSIIVMTAYQ